MVLRVLVAIALLCSVAAAEDKPWAEGVAPAEQKAALRLYEQANELFEKGDYVKAQPIYVDALRHWNHPGIHYNLAVCLINLDRTVEAYDELQKALKYQDAPLGKELYAQAQTYQRMLQKQIAMLEVRLATPGAKVQLDGQPLLEDAGTAMRTVLATEHFLVVEKPGYETENRRIVLHPGDTTTIVLEMKLKATGTTERRWARWMPWTVVGSSAVIGIVGGVAVWTSKAMFKEYDDEFAGLCMDGCSIEMASGVAHYKGEAESRQRRGFGIVAVGGVTLVTGLVLVVLNQPRLVGATVTPTIGKEHAGAMVSIPW